MLIYLILIFSIYFGFLLACMLGWMKFTRQAKSNEAQTDQFISVIIAVRDEESALPFLLDSVMRQDFPVHQFEVVFVDDHSSDNSKQIISEWLKSNPQVQGSCIPAHGNGKKQALAQGIKSSMGEIVLTTDADGVLPEDWISNMVASFHTDTTMVIGLVKIQQTESLFTKLQALEFSSLIGSGVAMNMLGHPVMCNGASLAFRKKSFETVNGYEDNLHIPSGDDEFLMRKLNKQFPGTIRSIQNTSTIVATRPEATIKSFVHQRLRWAGKWNANDSIIAKGLALFVFIFQIANIVALILLVTGESRNEGGVLLGIKCMLEGLFLFTVSKHTRQPFSIIAFLILQIIYPLYVVLIGILSQLLDYEWKGRRNQSVG